MAENWSNNQTSQATEARAQAVDEGLRIYMTKVYNYMGLGLLATALTAYIGAASGIYAALAQTPLIWLVVFAPWAWCCIYQRAASHERARGKNNVLDLCRHDRAFPVLCIARLYRRSVVRTFLITAASFGALSLYGYTTKRDLSGMGSFLFMGLIGIILASIVNFFMQSPAMHFAISVIGVLIFAGLTAYDTQDIKRIYFAGDSRDIAEKKAIMGALRLYLDFINMFLFLLQFLGNRE